jgi:hypothetical protein
MSNKLDPDLMNQLRAEQTSKPFEMIADADQQ